MAFTLALSGFRSYGWLSYSSPVAKVVPSSHVAEDLVAGNLLEGLLGEEQRVARISSGSCAFRSSRHDVFAIQLFSI